MREYSVHFVTENKTVSVPEGSNVMKIALGAGISVGGPCGGNGSCGKCMVRIRQLQDKDTVPGKFSQHRACQVNVDSDILVETYQVEISVQRKSMINDLGVREKVKVNPGVKKICAKILEPSHGYSVSDLQRTLGVLTNKSFSAELVVPKDSTALETQEFSLEALRELPGALRQEKHCVTATVAANRVIRIEPGDTTGLLCGVSVDLGTTHVAATLLDLLSGKHLATASATNTQTLYGADVISRITYSAQNQEGLENLHYMAVQVINSLIDKLCLAAGIANKDIVKLSVVGNSTMSHFLAKLDPAGLAKSPFVPVFKHSLFIEAGNLGLNISPHAQVHILPNIAGFLGSDTVGLILATDLHRLNDTQLAIDIGTNGEIALARQGVMVACSTAAGPAFEGAQITHGMRASAGAIERVSIGQDVEIKTIGDCKARGICGSGLVDAVAGLVKSGLVDPAGKLLFREDAVHFPVNLRERLGSKDKGRYFVLSFRGETAIESSVIVTQKDIRELQLAKAAIYAGTIILMTELGIKANGLDKVLLAGAFGSYIDKESALAIGLLPTVPMDKIELVGNAASVGAQLALLSKDMEKEAESIACKVRHIELAKRRDFQKILIEATKFNYKQSVSIDCSR